MAQIVYYLGEFRGKREFVYPMEKSNMYIVGDAGLSAKYQDKLSSKSIFTLKELKQLVMRKSWKRVSKRVFDDLLVREFTEAL